MNNLIRIAKHKLEFEIKWFGRRPRVVSRQRGSVIVLATNCQPVSISWTSINVIPER